MEHVVKAVETAIDAVDRESPNAAENGHQGPKEWHPCFFGCYDWHSAVHSHWLLVRCLRRYRGSLPEAVANRAAAVLQSHLTADNAVRELEGLHKEKRQWELPYGLAWFLRLVSELAVWAGDTEATDATLASSCSAALDRLEEEIRGRFQEWLTTLRTSEPDRAGLHGNASFALRLGLLYARERSETTTCEATTRICSEMVSEIEQAVLRLFKSAGPPPARKDGSPLPFLEPEIAEAQAVILALGSEQAAEWLQESSEERLERIKQLKPALNGDPHDIMTCHLIGRNFAIAEGLAELATAWPSGRPEETAELLLKSRAHLSASLGRLGSGGWMGDHWVGTFGVLALEAVIIAEGEELKILGRKKESELEERSSKRVRR